MRVEPAHDDATPGELVFPASRLRAFVILAGCSVFVLLALYTAIDRPLIGLLGALIFGAGLPVGLLMLRPGKVHLRLDAQGFEVATPFARRRTFWSDVQGFRLDAVRGHQVVAVVYRAGHAHAGDVRNTAASFASTWAAPEGVLPDSYAASPQELLRVLEQWRARHAPVAEDTGAARHESA